MTRDRKVLAIDPSLRNTGICYGDRLGGPSVGTLSPPDALDPVDRLVWFQHMFTKEFRYVDLGLVVIEDYAYSAAQGSHQLGELGGVIRTVFAHVPILLVNGQKVKKFATGNGGCKKPAVTAAGRKYLPNATNDEIDAFYLWWIAKLWLKEIPPPVDISDNRMNALNGLSSKVRKPSGWTP